MNGKDANRQRENERRERTNESEIERAFVHHKHDTNFEFITPKLLQWIWMVRAF